MYYEDGQGYSAHYIHGKLDWSEGTYRYLPSEEAEVEEYFGRIEKGQRVGAGRQRYRNGDEFSGHFSNDLPHGRGELAYSNGDRYVGDFVEGLKHGRGQYVYSNGDRYVGDWLNGLMHGEGDFQAKAAGYSYSGQFQRGLRHGQGTLRFAAGEIYEGEFQDGLMQGKGKYFFGNGSQYEVGHSNVKRTSNFEIVRKIIKYWSLQGDFEAELMQGSGVCRYANGMLYKGQFKADRRHGHGLLLFPPLSEPKLRESEKEKRSKKLTVFPLLKSTEEWEGSFYEGEFQDGFMHGKGRYRYANGAEVWNSIIIFLLLPFLSYQIIKV